MPLTPDEQNTLNQIALDLGSFKSEVRSTLSNIREDIKEAKEDRTAYHCEARKWYEKIRIELYGNGDDSGGLKNRVASLEKTSKEREEERKWINRLVAGGAILWIIGQIPSVVNFFMGISQHIQP